MKTTVVLKLKVKSFLAYNIAICMCTYEYTVNLHITDMEQNFKTTLYFIINQTYKQTFLNFLIFSNLLYPGQGSGGSRAFPGITGSKVGTNHIHSRVRDVCMYTPHKQYPAS